MPKESNEPLVTRLTWSLIILDRIAEAKGALKDLLKYGPTQEALHLWRELQDKYPNVSPAISSGFRLGYLAIVFAILGIYTIAGIALFGGSSIAPTTQSQVTPRSTATIQPTLAFLLAS
jgi:hypothetical protein